MKPVQRDSSIDPWSESRRTRRGTLRALGVISTGLALVLTAAWGCKRQHQRSHSLDETGGGGTPSERVEVHADPRFPRRTDAGADRRGLWVEQPRETGGVSSTALANSVADRLDELRTRCCGEELADCEGMEGRVLLKFTLAPNGTVRDVAIEETTIYDDAFQKCSLHTAATWTLAGHSGSKQTDVYLPLRARFASSDGADTNPP